MTAANLACIEVLGKPEFVPESSEPLWLSLVAFGPQTVEKQMPLLVSLINAVRRVGTKLLSDCGVPHAKAFRLNVEKEKKKKRQGNYLNFKQLNIWKTKFLTEF